MPGKALKTLLPIVLLAAAGGFATLGIRFRSTDVAAMASVRSKDPVSIAVVPPALQREELATDAYERPLFHNDRQPGQDGPPAPLPGEDPDGASDGTAESSGAPTLKGLIIGELGSKASLMPADGASAVWVKVGEEVAGWTVEAITSRGVRVRNGDEVVEINFTKDK